MPDGDWGLTFQGRPVKRGAELLDYAERRNIGIEDAVIELVNAALTPDLHKPSYVGALTGQPPAADGPDDPDRYAKAAHHAYHKATKDWVRIPSWNSPNCLKAGWRAAAQAVLGLARNSGEFTVQVPLTAPEIVDNLGPVRDAMRTYEGAIMAGQHGGVAAAALVDAIHAILHPGEAAQMPVPVVSGVAEAAEHQEQQYGAGDGWLGDDEDPT